MRHRGRPKSAGVLTQRELEVLALLREGLSNQAIADQLGISLSGAKFHVSEIITKLGVSSREEAAAWRRQVAWFTFPFDLRRPDVVTALKVTAAAGALVFVATLFWASPEAVISRAAATPTPYVVDFSDERFEPPMIVYGVVVSLEAGELTIDVPGTRLIYRVESSATLIRPLGHDVVTDTDHTRLRPGDIVGATLNATNDAVQSMNVRSVKVAYVLVTSPIQQDPEGRRFVTAYRNTDDDNLPPFTWSAELIRVWLVPELDPRVYTQGVGVLVLGPGQIALLYPYVADDGDLIATGIANISPAE